MYKKQKNFPEVLSRYIPNEFVKYVTELLLVYPVKFRISKPRKTKLGDYKSPLREGGAHHISVNADLNPYAFLITTLHEFAHLHTFVKFGHQVAPHGKEWKNEFKSLLMPLLKSEGIPYEIKLALSESVLNPKASTGTDYYLSKVLMKYNAPTNEDELILESLSFGELFVLKNRVFKLGKLQRKNFICKEVKTGDEYLVNRLAKVERYNTED